MASALKNLSDYDFSKVPDGTNFKVGIVVAEWNQDITTKLLKAAVDTLRKHNVREENIFVEFVPGTFELVSGAKMIYKGYKPDAVICIGCVIKGDTPHFEYICMGATKGITDLNLMYDVPFIFGVLTTLNLQQALDRCGGIHGNKGDEAAVTALKMIGLKDTIDPELPF